jgi:hypothetical protein
MSHEQFPQNSSPQNQPPQNQFGQQQSGQSFPAYQSQQPEKKTKTGLWIGLGAGALALILLVVFLVSMNGRKDSGAAAGSSENSSSAPAGPEGEAEQAVQGYVANLKDGKAQDAIKLLDTQYLSGFDSTAPQFKDEVYSTAKNRPQSFVRTSTEKVTDDYVKVTGKVAQKDRDLDTEFTVKKVGGQWKISPQYSMISAPTVAGSDDSFSVLMNGQKIGKDRSLLTGTLPGDYEFSTAQTKYFTSNSVTRTVWADGTDESGAGATTLTVKPTSEAEKAAAAAVASTLTKCAEKQDVSTCGSRFKVTGLNFQLTDLKVSVQKQPVLKITASKYTPTQLDVETSTPGTVKYDYKEDGTPASQTKDLKPSGTVTLRADGTVQEIKLY